MRNPIIFLLSLSMLQGDLCGAIKSFKKSEQPFLIQTLQRNTNLPDVLLPLITAYMGYVFRQKVAECKKQPTCVSLSHNGKHMVITDEGKEACILDAKTYGVLHHLQGHKEKINEAQFSRDSKMIITASQDGTAKIWDTMTGKLMCSLNHIPLVKVAHFNCLGRLAVTVGRTTPYFWDVRTARSTTHRLKRCFYASPRFNPVKPHQLVVAEKTNFSDVFLYDLNTQQETTLGFCLDVVRTVSFGPSGRRVVASTANKKIYIWDVRSVNRIDIDNTYRVHTALLSSDDRYVAIGLANGVVRIIDPQNINNEYMVCNDENTAVHSLAWYPQDAQLLTASADKKVRIWDMLLP